MLFWSLFGVPGGLASFLIALIFLYKPLTDLNPYYYSVMIILAMAVGGANATEIIRGAGVREKTFLSYPVEFTQAMPKVAAANSICCLFANLPMGAYLGDRRMMAIDRSSEVYFANAQIGIRGTQRVAVTVHGVGDTTDAGPICGLIMAA